MSEPQPVKTRFRQHLPLVWRMGYGRVKRMIAPHPLWDDPVFQQWHTWLQQTERWSLDDLRAYQFQQLKALLDVAYHQTRFYRRLYDEYGVTSDDIRCLDDLHRLPVITKEQIRANLLDMIPQGTNPDNLTLLTTSGSTGQPLGIYHNPATVDQVEMAFILRQWGWAGYRRGDPYATFRGQIIRLETANGHTALWDYVTDDNRLVLLAQDTSESTLHETIRQLRRFRPRFIQTYPSTLEIVARYMQREHINDIRVNAVFCESETLYDHQRRLFETVFGAQVYGGYGHSERAVDAVECEQHRGYHISMEYGILELLDPDDEPITSPGITGRITGTGLDTFKMPLIRYVTDDLATYAAEPCPCGRAHTLLDEIHGRTPDFIISSTGQIYPFGPIYASAGDEVPEAWQQIRELRFIQPDRGVLLVEMALTPGSDQTAIPRTFLNGLYEWLKPGEFDVRVRLVDSVQRNARGKIRLLEQQLAIDLHDLRATTCNPSPSKGGGHER